MKITCIGVGSMGSAIMRAICKKYNPKDITVTNRTPGKGIDFAASTGCNFCDSNAEAVKEAKYIFVAVKPNALEDLFKEIKTIIPKDTVIISMAAGVRLEKLERFGDDARFVRIMPNVPALIGKAMIGFTCNDDIDQNEIAEIKELLGCCGVVEQVPEKLMDCVTAVSGSGPAFAFMFIEAMADAAVRCGMPRSQAYTYAAQTLYGSAAMVLETGKHPGVLKDSVTSPAGTTIEGLAALEKDGFRNAVIDAVTAAYNKSLSMNK